MRDLMAEARKSFDYIVVDLPPLGPVIDVKAFAPLADGLVLVTEWGATPRALVRSVLNAEPAVAAKVLGLVLNKTDMKKLARYGSFGGCRAVFRPLRLVLRRQARNEGQGRPHGAGLVVQF